jgi:hypothetical protein
MAAKSKKGSKRGFDRQRAEIKELQRRGASGKLLDIQSKDELFIDEFAKEYGNGNKRFLRSEIERIAQNVVAKATIALDTFPKAMELGGRALEVCTKVDADTSWLRDMDVRKLSSAFNAIGDDPPSQLWRKYFFALNRVHARYNDLVGGLKPIAPLTSGNSGVLVLQFVTDMYVFHQRQIGQPPRKTRTGRFVSFLEAAWADLNFPEVPESTLGNTAERLPHSKIFFMRRRRR